MSSEQKHPLRTLAPQEEQELQRVDVVKRAKGLLAVRAGQSFTNAAREAGYKSGDSISQLVERFNEQGLGALLIAPGRGRKVTYTNAQRARIVAELHRPADRKEDQTATWSLMLLRGALRRTELPHIAKETIRVVLHEAGYGFGKTRTWCPTGTALRVRKAGTVKVEDPKGPEKKD
jgi:transposase